MIVGRWHGGNAGLLCKPPEANFFQNKRVSATDQPEYKGSPTSQEIIYWELVHLHHCFIWREVGNFQMRNRSPVFLLESINTAKIRSINYEGWIQDVSDRRVNLRAFSLTRQLHLGANKHPKLITMQECAFSSNKRRIVKVIQ